MTESNHPEPTPRPPSQLAPSSRRALAGGMTYTAGGGELELVTAYTLVDVLDAVSWALLGTAGLTPIEARTVLAALWAS